MTTEARIYDKDKRRKFGADSLLWVHVMTSCCYPMLMAIKAEDPRWIALAITCYVALASFAIRENRSRYIEKAAVLMSSLMPEFEVKHGQSMVGRLPVGVTPSPNRNNYDGDLAWDVGYLEIGDGVHYFGDIQTLHLSWRQVESVKVVGTLRPRLHLKYRLKLRSPLEFMSFELRDGSSVVEQYATLQQIRAKIAMLPDIPVLAAPT